MGYKDPETFGPKKDRSGELLAYLFLLLVIAVVAVLVFWPTEAPEEEPTCVTITEQEEWCRPNWHSFNLGPGECKQVSQKHWDISYGIRKTFFNETMSECYISYKCIKECPDPKYPEGCKVGTCKKPDACDVEIKNHVSDIIMCNNGEHKASFLLDYDTCEKYDVYREVCENG